MRTPTPASPAAEGPELKTSAFESLFILGSRVDAVSFPQAMGRIRQLLAQRRAHHIVTANTLMFLAAEQDRELQTFINRAALVVPESWGIAWASRLKNKPLPEFIPGIDLMLALCRMSARENHRVYLLGAKPGVAEQAAKSLCEKIPAIEIAGYHHGYFSKDDAPAVIQAVRDARPALLFVALSVPEQEKWIARHLEALGVPIVMGVGGSFDVLSGQLKRAPAWMRHWGIEWVYRTLQEPWRLQRIKGLPVYMWRVLREK